MHEIPETLAAATALATQSTQTAHPLTLEEVIQQGLQNWIQELLDEGLEGGYLTATLTATGLTIQDISGTLAYTTATLNAATLVPRFKQDAHGTLLAVQTQIRTLIDTGKVR